MSFVQPAYLWLLLLLVPLWAIAFVGPRRVAQWRRSISLVLRSLILCALVLALGGAQWVRRATSTTTVFVVDNSDSVTPAMRAQADQYVQTALRAMPLGDRGGVVVFGGDAIVDRPPSDTAAFVRTTTVPPSDQTDINRAVQLALAMLPSETRKRIVLLSDGAETRGRALDAVALAQSAQVPIDTVSLIGTPAAEDVALEVLEAPASAREGQPIRLTIQAQSGRATTAELQILVDRQAVLTTTVDLVAGPNRIPVTVEAPAPGFHAWEARLRAPDDTVGANNVQFGFTEVRGAPRILLVEGSPDRAANLEAALRSARLNPATIEPQALPQSLIGLDAYDVIVLVDVPYRALPERAAALLPAYVRELGRGLLMVGGANSFGAGGYLDTPVEQALPVDMDLPSLERRPPVSVVVVIDVSGSMAEEEDGVPKVQLAAEGAIRIAAQLDDADEITVIPFDSAAQGTVGPLPGSRRSEAIDQIERIGVVGGGINAFDALSEAARYVRDSDKPIRHIFTITDGADTVQQEGARELVSQLHNEGVTLTSIAIGDGADVPFIRDIAARGGGKFFLTERARDIPDILTDEAQALLQSYLVEEPFAPTRGVAGAALRGIDATPQLYGYVATTPKDTAQVVLASAQGDPVLAQWQYGLGRAAAWTSDLHGQWAKDWVAWDGFGRFAAQLVSDLLPTPSAEGLQATTQIEGTALAIDLDIEAVNGQVSTGGSAVGRLIGSDGSVTEVPLNEVGPGRYHGTTPLPAAGVYRAQVIASAGDGSPLGVAASGAVVPPSAEYLQRDGNLALLNALAQATGGRSAPTPAQAWTPPTQATRQSLPITWPLLYLAILLWPLDIAVRRLLLPRSRVIEAWLRRSRRIKLRDRLPKSAHRAAQPADRSMPAVPKSSSELPSAPKPPSPSTAPPSYADWRRTRRSVVERPNERRGE